MTDKQRGLFGIICQKKEKSKYIKNTGENKTKHNKMEKDTKYIVRYITQDDGIRASGFLPEVEVARYPRYNRCKDYSNIRGSRLVRDTN